MAEERQDSKKSERLDSTAADATPKAVKKKKSGFVFMLFLLSVGVGMGLHFSGYWDARPLFWSVIPRVPYLGEPLANLFNIPEQYSLTVPERRNLELAQWQERLSEKERSLLTRQTEIELISSDLKARNASMQELEAAKQEAKANTQSTSTEEQRKLMNQVAKTYQDMSPRNAARIVEQLPMDLAVELLQKLPIDVRASILARIQPQRAAELTQIMALPR